MGSPRQIIRLPAECISIGARLDPQLVAIMVADKQIDQPRLVQIAVFHAGRPRDAGEIFLPLYRHKVVDVLDTALASEQPGRSFVGHAAGFQFLTNRAVRVDPHPAYLLHLLAVLDCGVGPAGERIEQRPLALRAHTLRLVRSSQQFALLGLYVRWRQDRRFCGRYGLLRGPWAGNKRWLFRVDRIFQKKRRLFFKSVRDFGDDLRIRIARYKHVFNRVDDRLCVLKAITGQRLLHLVPALDVAQRASRKFHPAAKDRTSTCGHRQGFHNIRILDFQPVGHFELRRQECCFGGHVVSRFSPHDPHKATRSAAQEQERDVSDVRSYAGHPAKKFRRTLTRRHHLHKRFGLCIFGLKTAVCFGFDPVIRQVEIGPVFHILEGLLPRVFQHRDPIREVCVHEIVGKFIERNVRRDPLFNKVPPHFRPIKPTKGFINLFISNRDLGFVRYKVCVRFQSGLFGTPPQAAERIGAFGARCAVDRAAGGFPQKERHGRAPSIKSIALLRCSDGSFSR